MVELDDQSVITQLDSSGLRDRLRDLPEQCTLAWSEAKGSRFPVEWRGCSEVVIAGMGGSAIAGDLVADLAGPDCKTPIRVVRDFTIPGLSAGRCPGAGPLVIVCSYSGETEETVSMFHRAQSAQLPMAAIVGGGTLEQKAKDAGIPVMKVNAPGEPRSAVGYNMMLLAALLNQIGVISISDDDVAQAVTAAAEVAASVDVDIPGNVNHAKSLAAELFGGLTLVYGGGAFSGMALRWKSQLNENGKSWAYAEKLPELFHNSVESFPGGPEIRGRTTALMLKPAQASPELDLRYTVLAEMLDQSGITHHTLVGARGGLLQQSLPMIVLGDYISYYMGLLNGINPSETPIINASKARMAQ